MTSSDKPAAGLVDEVYPEVFNQIPPQPKDKKPGQLNDQQVKEFFEEGFVLVEDFFNIDAELGPVRDAINELVDGFAQKLKDAGKIKKLYDEFGFFDRLTMIEKEFPGANVIMHKLGYLPQSIKALWSNERLLNIMEQLLGTNDIMGHPVWNLRTKTPQNEATTVPWHQDSAYLDNDSYSVLQVTAWIPLLDAGEKEGCLEMVRRGHKLGRIAAHECCSGDTHYLMLQEDEMTKTLDVDLKNDCVIVPVKYGSMLLFANNIPHRSLNNFSDKIRWSLDVRWQDSKKKPGFYGLKQGIPMRSASDPNFKPDWNLFDTVNGHVNAFKAFGKRESDFDTTIPGPWMGKWKMTNRNRHTKRFEESAGGTLWHTAQ